MYQTLLLCLCLILDPLFTIHIIKQNYQENVYNQKKINTIIHRKKLKHSVYSHLFIFVIVNRLLSYLNFFRVTHFSIIKLN